MSSQRRQRTSTHFQSSRWTPCPLRRWLSHCSPAIIGKTTAADGGRIRSCQFSCVSACARQQPIRLSPTAPVQWGKWSSLVWSPSESSALSARQCQRTVTQVRESQVIGRIAGAESILFPSTHMSTCPVKTRQLCSIKFQQIEYLKKIYNLEFAIEWIYAIIIDILIETCLIQPSLFKYFQISDY